MSVIEVPIPGQDSPAGVLGVGCRSPRRFAEEDVNFVKAVANILAAAAARSRAEGAIRDQALHDPLTGLPNRLVLAEHGHTVAAPKQSEMSGVKRTVLVLDIDRFKEINDTLGHGLGDLVLLEVARRLRELGDPVELVARLGADEFAIVASSVAEHANADAIASRVLAGLAEAIDVGGVRLRLRGSVGVAEADVDEKGASLGVPALLRRAEVAMHLAKAEHRGVRHYSDDLERSSLSRLALASELADALDKDEFRLDYQPKIDARTKVVTGVEALVRWRHPTRGLLLPDVFIPLTEQTGMIRELTNWVLQRALSECASWHRAGRLIPVAVNLSAATVHDPELMDAVTTAVSRSGLPPESIELEITESAVMFDPDGALRSLQSLVDFGVRLSLDDFGTGNSSLSYLQRLPVTAVKIDKSFVEPLLSDDTAKAIVRAVVNLAHSLSLSVIAEGVDSGPVMEQLTALGCDALQGFYVASPMSPDRLEQWIATNSPTAARGTF
jgi:diguanylate cyclase (GGDEF)-like protein